MKKTAPWFNVDTRNLKWGCRNLQRKWRSTKIEDSFFAWHDSVASARNAYFSRIINLNRNNPKFLFDTVKRLTQKQTQNVGSSLSAGQFMDFFENKIKSIWEEIDAYLTSCLPHFARQDGDLPRRMGNSEATIINQLWSLRQSLWLNLKR